MAQVAAFVQGANDLRSRKEEASARFMSIVWDGELLGSYGSADNDAFCRVAMDCMAQASDITEIGTAHAWSDVPSVHVRCVCSARPLCTHTHGLPGVLLGGRTGSRMLLELHQCVPSWVGLCEQRGRARDHGQLHDRLRGKRRFWSTARSRPRCGWLRPPAARLKTHKNLGPTLVVDRSVFSPPSPWFLRHHGALRATRHTVATFCRPHDRSPRAPARPSATGRRQTPGVSRRGLPSRRGHT